MIYFDTSYLVRLYYGDPGFDAVRKLAATDNIASAWHGQAEMLAAFHRKLREGAITSTRYAALLGQFESDDRQRAFQWLPQGRETLRRIARVYAGLPSKVFLRAADALHLAVAAENGFRTVHSNDGRFLAAAKHFGLSGRDVIAES